jgi:hypothetical protein
MATTTKGCLDMDQSDELKLAVQACEAQLKLLHKHRICPGDSCVCHKISGQVQELLASFETILHSPAGAAAPCCCTATEATTEEKEQQQRVGVEVQLLKQHRISTVLTEGLGLLLSGCHSTNAVCHVADAFSRCGTGSGLVPNIFSMLLFVTWQDMPTPWLVAVQHASTATAPACWA